MKNLIAIAALVTLALSTACLDRHIHQVLYLEADGSVTWDLSMRFDQENPERTAAETQQRIDELEKDIESIEEAMWDKGAEYVATRITRERPPYAYTTRSVFPDASPVLEALFEDWPGLQWEVSHEKGRRVMRFFIDPESPLPDDILPLEIVSVAGKVGHDSDGQRAVRLESPEDWDGLVITW